MDFLNKQNMTYIIILIFILLSLIHLFNMKSDVESFITLTENQILSPNIDVIIPSTDLIQFGEIGKSTVPNNLTTILSKLGVGTLQLDSNNIFTVPGTVKASKIFVGVGGSPVRNTINCPEPMFISTTGDLTLESTTSLNIKSNLNFMNDKSIINVKDWGLLQGGRVHLNSTVDDIYLISKGTTRILKDTTWGSSGNLNVDGGIWCAGGVAATNGLSLTGSGNSGIGGALTITNTDKTGATEAHTWNIYNMQNYGKDYTGGPGKPGSGLSFWRYAKDKPCSGNLCERHMTLNDDGTTFFGGSVISANFDLTNWGIITGGRVHIRATVDNVYLMSKDTVYVYKDPQWTSSGNLSVGGIFTQASDRRLKENIKNISKTDKDKVLQLVPKTYNLINEKNKRFGLIAQEVEELYPELVRQDDKGMKSMNYIELIPLLLEQIKELKKSIPNQETVNTNVVNTDVLNIGGVSLTANELLKLKKLIN
jgi:hypothetical protein